MFRPFYDLKEQLESKLEVIYMFLFIQPVLLQSSCMYLNRSILIVRIAVWARESCWSAATLFKMLCKDNWSSINKCQEGDISFTAYCHYVNVLLSIIAFLFWSLLL